MSNSTHRKSPSTSTITSSSPLAERRKSTSSSQPPSPSYTHVAPKLQLVPHARTGSHDAAFSTTELELLKHMSFSDQDVSSMDFSFDEIFTFDKPQQRLSRVVEVSTPSRERDWSSFSFSHNHLAVRTTRHKSHKPKSIAEKDGQNRKHQSR